MYFAFTSMSTVGFGDLHPRSDYERVVCAFILLFGVSIFSYIMGIFISILEQIQQLNEENENGEELNMFFHMITKLNGGDALCPLLVKKITDHFEYNWENDKNYAFLGEGQEMLD